MDTTVWKRWLGGLAVFGALLSGVAISTAPAPDAVLAQSSAAFLD